MIHLDVNFPKLRKTCTREILNWTPNLVELPQKTSIWSYLSAKKSRVFIDKWRTSSVTTAKKNNSASVRFRT